MKLLEKTVLKNLELKNRVVMEPMCMYSALEHSGLANDFHLAHYTARAIGQVGLIIVEATGVLPEGRITDDCLGLYNDAQRDALKPVVDAVHRQGAKIGIQLNHAGRKCKAVLGVDSITAPSEIAFDSDYRLPKPLDETMIEEVFSAFKDAARRALEAGFDMIEIHAAHGYLISQFMSPISNKRTDQYKDGALFLKGVVDAIREVWPEDKVLGVRVSATDYEKDGQDLTDTIAMLSKSIHELDLINVSSGGITPILPHQIYPGYQVEMASAIKQALGKPVIACGLLGSPDLASYLLETDKADFIGLARPLLRNPHWVLEVMAARNKRELLPSAYIRAF